nr:unnamed protein product [Callosobruchus chinensis]
MAIRFIGHPALTCHLQPLAHRRLVGDLSLFHRYSNRFCTFELTSIISFFIHQEPSGSTTPLFPGCLWPGMDWTGDVFIEPASVALFKSCVN